MGSVCGQHVLVQDFGTDRTIIGVPSSSSSFLFTFQSHSQHHEGHMFIAMQIGDMYLTDVAEAKVHKTCVVKWEDKGQVDLELTS